MWDPFNSTRTTTIRKTTRTVAAATSKSVFSMYIYRITNISLNTESIDSGMRVWNYRDKSIKCNTLSKLGAGKGKVGATNIVGRRLSRAFRWWHKSQSLYRESRLNHTTYKTSHIPEQWMLREGLQVGAGQNEERASWQREIERLILVFLSITWTKTRLLNLYQTRMQDFVSTSQQSQKQWVGVPVTDD